MFVRATAPRSAKPADSEALRPLIRSGKIEVIGEIQNQQLGLRADDPALDPMWRLAEENDVPVGIHMGGAIALIGKDIRSAFRAELTSPFQLEGVLKRHPKLRIYVMHAAMPLTDEMTLMLFTYPSLYVDISANDWNMPRAQFYDHLKRLVDAGFSKRIMFGSDQTIFPQAIGLAIKTIEDAPFLTAEQKRDIFYSNAARFLRLSPAQIAADHRR